jgi:hypothetical protein
MENLAQRFKEFLESEEGQKSIKEFGLKIKRDLEHKERWTDLMWNRIKDDIDSSIQRMLEWYDSDKYRNREYSLGYEPRETLLWVLFGVSEKYGSECNESEIEKCANMFTGDMYKIGSYVIQVMHGQGSVIKIDKI